jgi:farnesyl-diphosphate farnesyltransferase
LTDGKCEKDRDLMIEFDKIISEYLLLRPEFQDIIQNITQQMGDGMAKFVEKRIETKQDYDEYCHYVAGLVGIGLSRLFSASNLEDNTLQEFGDLANSMGLFLQKTNIIRDFHEDFHQGRLFWPKEVWSSYTQDLSEFFSQPQPAINCLNELILDALRHIPDCIEYLSKLKNPAVFNFCAIPQVMAISTLTLCFNNPDVFHRHVKLRRGTTIRLISQSQNIDKVKLIFVEFSDIIARKIQPHQPHFMSIQLMIGKIKKICISSGMSSRTISSIVNSFHIFMASFCLLLAIFLYYYSYGRTF